MMVPKPLHRLRITSNPNELMSVLRALQSLLFTRAIVLLRPSTPHNQNIRWLKLNSLILSNSLDIFDEDFVA